MQPVNSLTLHYCLFNQSSICKRKNKGGCNTGLSTCIVFILCLTHCHRSSSHSHQRKTKHRKSSQRTRGVCGERWVHRISLAFSARQQKFGLTERPALCFYYVCMCVCVCVCARTEDSVSICI